MAAFHSHHVQLALSSARGIIQYALADARARDLKPMTVVVLDTGGHPVAMEREDGAGIARFDVARGKAWAALGVGTASGAFGAANNDRPAFLAAVATATDGHAVPVAAASSCSTMTIASSVPSASAVMHPMPTKPLPSRVSRQPAIAPAHPARAC